MNRNSIKIIILMLLLLISNSIFSATSTLSQVQHNPRIYTAIFNEVTQEYDSVSTVNGTTATLTTPVEYEVEFGGTCSDGALLESSLIKLVGDTSIKTHTWEDEVAEGAHRKSFGSTYTQHQHLLKACNSELRNIIDGDPFFPHGVTLEELSDTSFTIFEVRTHRAQHTLHCSDGSKAQKLADINTSVICEAAKVTPKRKKVKKVKAKLNGVSHGMQAQCPINASLDVQIQTNVATEVQYKIVSGTGLVSHSKTMTVNEKNSEDSYEGNATISFEVPMNYEPSAGTNSATSDIQTNQTPENEYTQNFRVEISKPHQMKSEYVNYYVTCLPSAAPTLASGLNKIKTSEKPKVGLLKNKNMSLNKNVVNGSSDNQTATGQATGKRQHKPFTISKGFNKDKSAGTVKKTLDGKKGKNESGKSTPLIYQVLTNNENVTASKNIEAVDLVPSFNVQGSKKQGREMVLQAKDAKARTKGKCVFDMSFSVKNTGNSNISSKFNNSIQTIGENLAWSSQIPTLGANQSKEFKNIKLKLKEGVNEIRVVADDKNEIDEVDEKNNVLGYRLKVEGDCSESLQRKNLKSGVNQMESMHKTNKEPANSNKPSSSEIKKHSKKTLK